MLFGMNYFDNKLVRANFILLLERMAQVGEEARRAENRRWLVSMEEG